MSRLSNSIREQMARALTKHRFSAQADELCRQSVALFNAVYDDWYDEQTRKLMASLVKRHKEAFQTGSRFTVNVRGMQIRIGAQNIGTGKASWSAEVAVRPILHGDRFGGSMSYSDCPLADRMGIFADALRLFNEAIDPAYNKALGTLGQFSTGKKLATEWPEAMPVIGSLIPEDDRTLPVIQLAAINSEFDLPPALADAA